MRKEFDKAKNAVSQAIKIAPNYADGYGLLALISNNLGESEKAIEYVTKGMQINPYYTWDYPYNLGRANYMLGNYDAAIISLEQAQERNENAIPIKMFLATSYVKAGRLDDAEWIVEQMKVLNPVTSLSHFNRTIPIINNKLKMEFLEDLRKAGVPE
jgi:tetratricopeptide (TPR) repeat protein